MSFWADLDFGCEPSPEEAAKLKANFDRQCQKAATALAEADVLLFVTGAGFSADSGLAVYADVARVPAYQERGLTYMEICMPDWIDEDPSIFYGFWGQCHSDYRTTKPHEGYDILARWKNDKNNSSKEKRDVAQLVQESIQRKVLLRRPFDDERVIQNTPYHVDTGPAGACFSYTSNVDAHFFDTFEAHEIYQCHGNIELWQCSSPYCTSGGIWRAPLNHSFYVDTNTMLAPPTKPRAAAAAAASPSSQQEHPNATPQSTEQPNSNNQIGMPHACIGHTAGSGARTDLLKHMPSSNDTKGWFLETVSNGSIDSTDASDNSRNKLDGETPNWPRCFYCQSLARPAILMFGDFGWKRDEAEAERWNLWRESVLDLCKRQVESNSPLKVCIMEIGCGMNVPTCRSASERMVRSVTKSGGEVALVRINPDLPLAPHLDVSESLIPIMERGLQALKQIDEIYTMKKQKPTSDKL